MWWYILFFFCLQGRPNVEFLFDAYILIWNIHNILFLFRSCWITAQICLCYEFELCLFIMCCDALSWFGLPSDWYRCWRDHLRGWSRWGGNASERQWQTGIYNHPLYIAEARLRARAWKVSHGHDNKFLFFYLSCCWIGCSCASEASIIKSSSSPNSRRWHLFQGYIILLRPLFASSLGGLPMPGFGHYSWPLYQSKLASSSIGWYSVILFFLVSFFCVEDNR